MKVKTITFGRTVQVKQFEPARIEVTAELEEGDDPKAMFQELRDLVNDQVRAVR